MSPEPESDPKDGRSKTSAENGRLHGGQPKGSTHSDKKTYPAEELAQATAEAILQGKRSPLTLSSVGPVTDEDKRVITRITGEPAEAFQSRLTSKLEAMADKTADIIMDRLDEDPTSKAAFRPDTLPSILAIALDKLQALSGRASSIGSVHVQINNITSSDRPTAMSSLRSLRGDKQTDAITV